MEEDRGGKANPLIQGFPLTLTTKQSPTFDSIKKFIHSVNENNRYRPLRLT